jgi:hypothetical protein
MSLRLTTHGGVLFGDYYKKLRPKFADFEIVRDGEHEWRITCPGKGLRQPLAQFTGTYIEASKALRIQLVTSRMLQ